MPDRATVVAWSLLPLFDAAAADACEFLKIPRSEFFLRAQAWIDELNREGQPVDPGNYYQASVESNVASCICANVWLQFSAQENWSLLQRLTNLANADCLDFGCGTAAMSFSIRDRLRSLWLCDVPNRVQEFVRWRVRRANAVNVQVLAPHELRNAPQLQIVFALDVFEHLPNCSAVFAELHQHIVPNGILLFNAPWASQFSIREHLPEAEADWFRAGGGNQVLMRSYRRLFPLPHGGLYVKSAA